ncbi:MAG TPA: RecQ family ATP-dependent DNA helicase, partial [Pirellulaceae bacterium]|nr:RecQ family ATP-dependent DNA helicase [Pirellulaceae bacterium]
SPLIALMKDQIDALAARGIPARRLDSTLSADEYREVMRQVRAGELRMLYVAPERFQNERFREAIQHIRVSLFAVDEAHCISEWGHNFRPDYLKLIEFARQCRAERVLALTATATPQVLSDICRAFAIDSQCAVRTGFYRPNLTILTTPASSAERDSLLVARLKERPAGPTIVYVTLQRTAEEVAARLSAAGFRARPYHAGMEDETRAAVQDWFLETNSGIVVATIAFGMGVDKANIRYVYHYNLPKSLENFSQEIGRSGRDGAPAICETFVCMEDLNALENFAYGDTPSRSAVESLVREIFSLGPQFDVSYYELAGRHDIRILVVRTLLTYLELDGYLEGGTPFYSTYKFKPLKSSQEILSHFDGERREFVASIFRQVRKAKTWMHIDVDAAAQTLAAPRDRIVRALDYLGEQGWIELEAEGTRNQYRRMKLPADQAALAADLHQRTIDRQQREIARLNQVLDLVRNAGCQVNSLCSHFGEERGEPCGHCTWCIRGGSAVTLSDRPAVSIDDVVIRRALALRGQHPQALADASALARLLCGITSPGLTRAKLSGNSLFGALADADFPAVRQRLVLEGARE